MKKYKGVNVSPGIALGKSLCIDIEFNITNYQISENEVERELKRLDNITRSTIEELDKFGGEIKGSNKQSEIITIHKNILKDHDMLDNIRKILREEYVTLEKALDLNLDSIKAIFADIEEP
jgi:phosphoenolpyruvate-protein kinase (PTS system EI component)